MQPIHHRRIMRAAGLEPATHRLKVYCSKNRLSYTREVQLKEQWPTATIIIGCVSKSFSLFYSLVARVGLEPTDDRV